MIYNICVFHKQISKHISNTSHTHLKCFKNENRVRVLGTDYGSSWVRELTWALPPGEESIAPALAADPWGNCEEREPRQF